MAGKLARAGGSPQLISAVDQRSGLAQWISERSVAEFDADDATNAESNDKQRQGSALGVGHEHLGQHREMAPVEAPPIVITDMARGCSVPSWKGTAWDWRSSQRPPALAQPGQAPLGLLLLEEGVDRLADQGDLATAATQRQGLQSLALPFRTVDRGSLYRAEGRCWEKATTSKRQYSAQPSLHLTQRIPLAVAHPVAIGREQGSVVPGRPRSPATAEWGPNLREGH